MLRTKSSQADAAQLAVSRDQNKRLSDLQWTAGWRVSSKTCLVPSQTGSGTSARAAILEPSDVATPPRAHAGPAITPVRQGRPCSLMSICRRPHPGKIIIKSRGMVWCLDSGICAFAATSASGVGWRRTCHRLSFFHQATLL
jgi:hypothetical protein